jgi:3-oxoadipate enol-lactonase
MQADLNGVGIRYEIEGPKEAPFVVLSHSLASSLELWDLQMAVLRENFRVLRFDTRGHGGSLDPPGPYSIEMLAADLIGLLDLLGIERTHFAGISMGAMIGQVFACRHPDRLNRLVLCSTTCRSDPGAAPMWEERIRVAQTKGIEALVPEILKRWLSDHFRRDEPELTEKIREMILATSVNGYVGCSQAIRSFDICDELDKVKAPTLIIAGRMDESTPVSAAMAIQERIKNCEFAVMPGALHLCNIEAAESFNQALASFLEK